VIAYKFLGSGAIAPFTGFRWPVPASGEAGPWVEARSSFPQRGIHACREVDLAYWLDAELWRAELTDPVIEDRRQVVSSRGRLLSRVAGWGPEMSARFAEQAALMARDRVAAALDRAGLAPLARVLEGCADLLDLGAAARTTLQSPAPVASLAEYLAEAAESALAGDHAVSAYISARVAVPSAGGDETEFAAERERQARWLAEQLGLCG